MAALNHPLACGQRIEKYQRLAFFAVSDMDSVIIHC